MQAAQLARRIGIAIYLRRELPGLQAAAPTGPWVVGVAQQETGGHHAWAGDEAAW